MGRGLTPGRFIEINPLRLYRIETGATWYVAAHTEHQAVAEWVRCMHEVGAVEEVPEELKGYKLAAMTEDEIRSCTFRSDVGRHRLMWDVFKEQTKPGVVACSEWP